MTHYFQIEKYNKNISKTERNKYLIIKKMPRIQVKSLKTEEDIESLKNYLLKKIILKKNQNLKKKKKNP